MRATVIHKAAGSTSQPMNATLNARPRDQGFNCAIRAVVTHVPAHNRLRVIVSAIMDGTAPAGLTVTEFVRRLP
jgi:hypothetical protein